MTSKPIFVATHPRACSTAFERVFMTKRDALQCVHEPFGEAWYYGPERLSDRFKDDEKARAESGSADTTYRDTFEDIERQNVEGKRLFIKDMAQYWIPPDHNAKAVAPSLVNYRRGVGTVANDVDKNKPADGEAQPKFLFPKDWEPGNPTVIPDDILRKYHFTFLIRHPRSSIPSYYRCTIPPLNEMTKFNYFDPVEAGYKELRLLFNYLVKNHHIGPKIAGDGERAIPTPNGANVPDDYPDKVDICVIDADDLLDNPEGVIEAFCKSTGVDYSPAMLKWDDESTNMAKEMFEKWRGFHEDALQANELRARTHKKAPKTDEQLHAEWSEKFGTEAADTLLKTVEENVEHYEYLKQFALKV